MLKKCQRLQKGLKIWIMDKNNYGFFYYIWLCFFDKVIKKSGIYKLLTGIYSGISGMWKKSGIVSFFKKEVVLEFTEKSFFGRFFRLPFTILDKIRERYHEKLTWQKENSFVIRGFKYLLHNFLAINLRFIGVLLVSASLIDIVVRVAKGAPVVISFILLLVGIVLSFFCVNVCDYIGSSVISKLAERFLGTKLSYDFYYVTKCGKGAKLSCAVFFGLICGLLSSLFSPVLAFLFLFGILYVSMVLYKTEFGLYTTAFLAPIVPTMVLVGLCLLTGFSLIVKAVTSKKFTWKYGVPEFLVMLIIFLFLVSAITSYAMVKSIQIWLIYAVFMGFFFVVVNTIKTKKQFFDLATVIVISSLAVCAYGIMQYVFGWNTTQSWMDEEMFTGIKMRIYSTLENPNVLGEYILLTLPIAIGLMWTKKGALSKVFYGGISIVLFVAIILTYSRGCWIGLLLAAAVFVTFVAGKLWGLVLIVLPFIPMFLPESIIERFSSIGNMQDSSTSYRVFIWFGTILMLKDFWITGIGLGSEAFEQIYPFYSYSSIVAPHAHNLFLNLLAETGVAGIATFIIILFVILKRLSGIYAQKGKGGATSTMIVAFAAAIAGFLLQGMFDNCFYNYRVFMIFWLIAAAALSSAAAQNEELKEAAAENA